MLIHFVLLVAIFVSFVMVGEYLLNRFHRTNEASRKLMHVAHGAGLAALAFWVSLDMVVSIELLFFASMCIGRYLYANDRKRVGWVHYLGKAYRVGRLSYGEFFFPIAAIITALVASSKWEFAAAILVLGLADASAALVGTRYGKTNSYKVFGQKKSLVGSLAFLVVATAIVSWFILHSGGTITGGAWGIVWLPLLLTVTENLGVYGSDNLLIPLVAVIAFNLI